MLVSNEKKETDLFVIPSIYKIKVTTVKGISQFLIYFFSAALPIHQKFIGKSPTELEAWVEFIIQYPTFSSWDTCLEQQLYFYPWKN